MKVAILSDIHANYPALQAVCAHAEGKQGVEAYWLLGDLLGYGPHPVLCLNWLRDEARVQDWVLGNHEAMLLGRQARTRRPADEAAAEAFDRRYQFAYREMRDVAQEAQAAAELNAKAIAAVPETQAFWEQAFVPERLGPRRRQQDGLLYALEHGSAAPGQELSQYLFCWRTYSLAKEVAAWQASAPVCVWHGHTHIAGLVALDVPSDGDSVPSESVMPGQTYQLGAWVTVANPGSVGQPRNTDRRACYAVLDTQARTVVFHRVHYPYKETIRDLAAAGYPDGLMRRLHLPEYPGSPGEVSETWIANFDRQAKA